MAQTSDKDRDDVTGTETTGHEWDGIRELDTPLPKWWLWTFYACIIWGIGYTIAYPAWPLVHGSTQGVLGYHSRTALQEVMAERDAARKPITDKIAAMSIDDVASNEDLARFARAGGAAIFRNYCSQCHGSGATGAKGYPNLQDDDWLWGGTRDDIETTIAHGIRYAGDADTRESQMPAFGRDGILDRAQIGQVADYVLSLSGKAAGSDEGRQIFADNCSGCHGENGEGNRDLGAPNLTDAIWLYGGDRATVIQTITNARAGVMPAWSGRLSAADVKEVALYVHDLGGGE